MAYWQSETKTNDHFALPRAQGELFKLFKQRARLLGLDSSIDKFLEYYAGLNTVAGVNQEIHTIQRQIAAIEFRQMNDPTSIPLPNQRSLPSIYSTDNYFQSSGGSLANAAARVGGELSDVRIRKLVRTNRIDNFGGVFAKDELASRGQAGRRYIINMQNHTGGGTHWVYLDTTNPKHFYYCDSFGVIPPTEVVDFAKRYHARLTSNTTDMQSYHSDACGWYCLYMMAQMQRGRKMNAIVNQDFVNLRTKQPRRNNDQVLRNFFA